MAVTRALGIAAALLVLGPVGFAVASEWTAADAYGEATAGIYDVELFEPPQKKVYDPSSFRAAEQLVEGHTVFATIDLQAHFEETSGNVTITGLVRCEKDVQYRQWDPIGLGFGIPYKVDHAEAECVVAERVVISPDPGQWQAPTVANVWLGPVTPTGVVLPFTSPDGTEAYSEEFSFDVVREMQDGRVESHVCYAWAVPVVGTFAAHDGDVKNLYAPLPIPRLQECGAEDYDLDLERSF